MDTKNMKFLRGARLLQWTKQSLEEVTLTDLQRNIVTDFPNTTKRQHATDPVQIVEMKLSPAIPTGDLLCDCAAKSENKVYDTKILFLQVNYEDDDTPQNVTFTGADGETYNITPISLTKSNVKVRCDCLDFRWRFSVWNDSRNALYGDPPPPYQKKTDRPPVNPNQTPGICKHLIKTVDALGQAGLITN